MATSSSSSLASLSQVRATNRLQTTASATIRLAEPDFQAVSSAIRSFLRNEYAEEQFGYEEIPTRISTYSGKGVGHYATAEDGRADWTPDFKRYIYARTDRARTFAFTPSLFSRAMQALKIAHPRWHEAIMLFDVQTTPISSVAAQLGVHQASVHRYRRSAIFFLYPYLLIADFKKPRPMQVRYFKRSSFVPEAA